MATAAEIEDLMTGPLVTWVCIDVICILCYGVWTIKRVA